MGQNDERRDETDGFHDIVLGRVTSGRAFVLEAPKEIETIWGTDDRVLWSKGEALLIVGPTGVGKTTLTGQLLEARLGITDHVLGFAVTPGKERVLYVAADRPPQVARSLRRLFDESHADVLEDRLRVWAGPLDVDLARVPETLAEIAKVVNADTVIIDSLKDVAMRLSEDESGQGISRAFQTMLSEGIEVIALHHQRKGSPGDKPKSLADVYGSTWITAGVGSVILLWGEAGNALVELRHLKQPGSEVGPLKVCHDHEAGRTAIEKGFELLRYLRTHPQGATATEVAKAKFEASKPSDNQRKQAERELKRAERNGLVHREGGPARFGGNAEGARYFLVERHRSVADSN